MDRFQWGGPGGLPRNIYRKFLHQVFRISPKGTNIYEREWDLLIIIDACRFDMFREIAPTIDDRFKKPDSITSLDTKTPEWMEKTFIKEYENKTASSSYVCGNPFSAKKIRL